MYVYIVCEARNWEIDSSSGFVKLTKIETDVGPAGLRTYEKGTVIEVVIITENVIDIISMNIVTFVS
jgi:hypothetical protein